MQRFNLPGRYVPCLPGGGERLRCIGVVWMKPRTIGYSFCITLLAVACAGHSAWAQEVPVVQTPIFDIEYKVNEAALPLESVRLWYTTDGGLSWSDFGKDEDRISPIRFRAPSEGMYGFYFVLTNSAGPSSAPPAKTTKPQQAVLVDSTPPLVQLHQVRAAPGMEEITVQIRWSAVDSFFP